MFYRPKMIFYMSVTFFFVTPFNRVLGATAFIILGNIFLVSFGNHQSPGTLLVNIDEVLLFLGTMPTCMRHLFRFILMDTVILTRFCLEL